jgi:putative (di)nucleoside polyphosphate hydrolase
MSQNKKGYRETVVAVIQNEDGKFLSLFCTRNNSIDGVKKDENIWKLPQGGVDRGESVKDTVLREMKEELGVSFLEKDLVVMKDWKKNFSYHFVDESNKPCFEIRLYPVLIQFDSKLNIDLDFEENSKYEWVSKSEFMKKDLGIRKEAYENILVDFGL